MAMGWFPIETHLRRGAPGSGGQSDLSTASFWCVHLPLSWMFSPLRPSMSGP
jgi:hypothetical protein